MKREFLKGLELSDETIDKIMIEYGKSITEAKGNAQDLESKVKDYESEISTYKTKIADLEKLDGDKTKIQQELDELKKTIADNEAKSKAEKEDEILTNNIKSAFGEKKFINAYTEQAILNDIKTALKDVNNQGKSAKDLFEELTKDKDGIFVNPNSPQNMNGMNQNISTNVTKEAFEKMGYQERLTLKKENPDLYQSFLK
jgi:phage-related protein